MMPAETGPAVARARQRQLTESLGVRWLLIGLALTFLTLFLAIPLTAVGKPFKPELRRRAAEDVAREALAGRASAVTARLAAGQAEAIHVVYVRFPDLEVTIDRQRYTCLEPRRRYRYESMDSDFTREIEVDQDGLVVTYPGLFRRVL